MMDLRCVICRAEFDSVEYPEGLDACSGCGDSDHVPADPRTDQEWYLTLEEWLMIVSLAVRWEESFLKEEEIAVVPIIERIVFDNKMLNEDGEHPVVLSSHELSILTMFASNAQNMDQEESIGAYNDGDLERALSKLRMISKEKISLTFEDEIQLIRDYFAGTDTEVIVHYGDVEDLPKLYPEDFAEGLPDFESPWTFTDTDGDEEE